MECIDFAITYKSLQIRHTRLLKKSLYNFNLVMSFSNINKKPLASALQKDKLPTEVPS